MNNDLARRAVACPGWRWLPGMLTRQHGRVIDGNGVAIVDGARLIAPALDRAWTVPAREVAALPDLTDAATVGALLALVREAWEPHRGSHYIASTMQTGSGWGVRARYGSEGLAAIVLPTYETEAAALVAALEAAP